MKKETLYKISKALNHEGAVDEIAKRSFKSKATVYNVFNSVHNNNAVIEASLAVIEEKALENLQIVTEARKEFGLTKAAQPSKH